MGRVVVVGRMLGAFNFAREMGVDWMEVHSYTKEVVVGMMLEVLVVCIYVRVCKWQLGLGF